MTFIDSDDLLMPNVIERVMSSLVVQNVCAQDLVSLQKTLLFCNRNFMIS